MVEFIWATRTGRIDAWMATPLQPPSCDESAEFQMENFRCLSEGDYFWRRLPGSLNINPPSWMYNSSCANHC